MELKEYQRMVAEIKRKSDRKIKDLSVKFALENSHVENGDIITDHYHTLKVEKIDVANELSKVPQCLYRGPRWTRAGKPFVSGEISYMYQSNIEEINGESYRR